MVAGRILRWAPKLAPPGGHSLYNSPPQVCMGAVNMMGHHSTDQVTLYGKGERIL